MRIVGHRNESHDKVDPNIGLTNSMISRDRPVAIEDVFIPRESEQREVD